MVVIWIFFAILIMFCIATTWSDIRCAVRGIHSKRQGRDGATDAPQVSEPQTLEGVLARQLMNSQITPVQYRRAMTDIAARDAERHPVDLPPDCGPSPTR